MKNLRLAGVFIETRGAVVTIGLDYHDEKFNRRRSRRRVVASKEKADRIYAIASKRIERRS